MEKSKDIEIRKVQGIAKDESLAITLPKRFVQVLGITKGDFVKIQNESSKIIIQRVLD